MKFSKFILQSFALFFFIIISVKAQPTEEWAKMYFGSSIWATGLCIDSSDNLILAGNINRQQSFIVKYDQLGNQLWARLIPDIPVVYSSNSNIVVDENNNIYISGQNISKIVTKKFNAEGKSVWSSDFRLGSFSLSASTLEIDDSSNIYVCQNIGGFFQQGILLVKYDSTGNIKWEAKCRGFNGGYLCHLNIDKYKNVYLVSTAYGLTNDFVTVKYDKNGDSLWSSYYRTNLYDLAYTSILDKSQNIFVTGESERFENGTNGKITTIKYDSNGTEKWVRKYYMNNISSDRGISLVSDQLENIYVSGVSRSHNGDFDFVTIKYSQQGDSLWVRRFNGAANLDDVPSKMVIDSAGNIYVTGYSTKSNNVKEIITLKYNTSGQLIWSMNYNYPVNSIGHYLVRDNNSNLYIAGSNSVNSNGNFTVCIKYSQPIGINSNSNEIPVNYMLYDAFPNPFNPVTNIKFEILKAANVTFKVYDISGREIINLNEYKLAGSYEVQFDGSNFASGMYFYKLETDGFTDSKKMVLLK